jgi:hypothetical protein
MHRSLFRDVVAPAAALEAEAAYSRGAASALAKFVTTVSEEASRSSRVSTRNRLPSGATS